MRGGKSTARADGALGRLTGALAALFVLAGCSVVELSEVYTFDWLMLVSEPDANANNPVALDMVLVYEPGAVDAVATLTAADWFQRKTQFKRDFPTGIGVKSWELVPAQTIGPIEFEEEDLENDAGDRPVAGFVFADYFSPGDHRARLENRPTLRIRLGRDDFTLESFDAPG